MRQQLLSEYIDTYINPAFEAWLNEEKARQDLDKAIVWTHCAINKTPLDFIVCLSGMLNNKFPYSVTTKIFLKTLNEIIHGQGQHPFLTTITDPRFGPINGVAAAVALQVKEAVERNIKKVSPSVNETAEGKKEYKSCV